MHTSMKVLQAFITTNTHTQTCAQTVRNKILKICAYKYMSICVATATPCDRKIAK